MGQCPSTEMFSFVNSQWHILVNSEVINLKYVIILGDIPFDVPPSWLRSIVVRTPVLAGELSLSCARLMAGRVTTLWVKRPLSVNQHGQLSQPSLRGRLNE